MNTYIDRLRLNAPGLAEPDAERLALLVANGLAAGSGLLAVGRQVDGIEANITVPPDTPAGELAGIIVAEILRQLNSMT